MNSHFGPNEAVIINSGKLGFLNGVTVQNEIEPVKGVEDFDRAVASVYIIPGSEPLATGSLLHDINGSPNIIVAGDGGFFHDEVIGFTHPGGNLEAGTYSVVYDEDQDGILNLDHDAVFPDAFTVDAPPYIPGLATALVRGETKDKWRSLAMENAKWIKSAAVVIGEGRSVGEALGVLPFLPAMGGGFLRFQWVEITAAQFGLAADPPDPNFRLLAPLSADAPIELVDSDPLRTSVLRVAQAVRFETALEAALLHEQERYQGAADANDAEWALIQGRALRDTVAQLRDQIGRTDAALADLRGAVLTDPRDLEASTASVAALAARVATSGFTAEELREFRGLGLSSTAINDLQNQIAGLQSLTYSRAGFAADIVDLIAAESAVATNLGDAEVEMQSIVTGLESQSSVPQLAPVAAGGGPYNIAAGAPSTLDGTHSTDSGGTIVSWNWDLNLDGKFDDATGPTPTVTLPQGFDGFIGLQVTDNNGRTSIAYARMTVADTNTRPTIAAFSPDTGVQKIILGNPLPLTVTAADVDGDPTTTTWFVDDSAAGSGPSFTYAPAATAEIGMHTVRVEVSDNNPSGGRAVQEWTVAVFPPGFDNPPPPPPQLDLIVSQVDTSGLTTNPQTLEATGTVVVTVANQGTDALVASRDGPVTVQLFEDRNANGVFDPGVDNFLGTASFSGDIPPGGSVTVSFTVHTIVLFRDNPIYAVVDPDNTIPETNETNNTGNSGLPSHYVPTSNWLPLVKWQWGNSISSLIIEAAPAVAPLIDTNGDGRIDRRDIPAVIFNYSSGSPRLAALRGDTGQVIFDVATLSDIDITSVPTVGDLDDDGLPEILVTTRGERLCAFNNDGTLKWRSQATPSGHSNPFPVLVDLDGDGKSEILMGTSVFNYDGSLRFDYLVGQHSALYLGGGEQWGAMQPADLNLDGIPEIIAGPSALDRNGRMLWSWRELADVATKDYVAELSINDGPWIDQFHTTVPLGDGWTTVANLDSDPFPEIIVVSAGGTSFPPGPAGGLWIFRHDGSLFAPPVPLLQNGAGNTPRFDLGPPTVADFDGDGKPDIAITAQRHPTTQTFADPFRNILYVFHTDGTELWHKDLTPGDINTYYPAPVAFDFDGDGVPELVTQDMQYLYILDGRTGATRFQIAINNQFTLIPGESPVIADVDNDGSAEIVAFEGGGFSAGSSPQRQGLLVLGDANANWGNARRSWNQWLYQPGFTSEDGSVPAHARNSWEVQNGLRTQVPIDGVSPFAAPDLSVSRITFDTTGCGAPAAIAARVGNGGSLQAGAGVPVNFFLGDPSTGGILLGTRATSQPLFPGQFEDVTFLWTAPISGQIFVTVNEPLPAARVASADLALLPNTWARASSFTGLGGVPVNRLAFNGIDGNSNTPWFPLDPNIDPGSPFYEVHFPFPVEVSSVTIQNVANGYAFVGTGTLTFSNGFSTSINLDTNGVGSVMFPEQAGITWIRLTSTATGSFGAGLSEFVAGGSYVPPTFLQKEGTDFFGNNVAAAGVTGLPCDPAADFTPRVVAGPDQQLDQGDTLTLPPAYFTDAGRLSTHAATIDWGDGSPLEPGVLSEAGGAGTVAGTHTFPRAGTFPVTVAVTDAAGQVGSSSFTAIVHNLPAVVMAGDDQTTLEGNPVNLSASFADRGIFDTHTATIDWGDGSPVEPGVLSEAGGAGTVTGQHVYRDDGNYTVTVSVTDSQDAKGTGMFHVLVQNVAPSVVVGPDQLIDEGSSVSLTGASFSDPGLLDTHIARIDWGDNTPYGVGILTGGTLAASHIYLNNGDFLVTVTVMDDDGGAGSGTFHVLVGNVAPSVFVGPNRTIGSRLTLPPAWFRDPGVLDTHTASIDWGDGVVEPGNVFQSPGSGTVSGAHTYLADGSYTVRVTVTDSDGDSGQAALQVMANVSNQAPVVVLDATGPLASGTDHTFAFAFTDANPDDSHVASVDWGDANPPEAVPLANDLGGFGTGFPHHTYAAPGTYHMTVRVSDNRGGEGLATQTIQVTGTSLPPVATADVYQVNQAAVLTVAAPGVLGNDNDPDGKPLTTILVDGPAHGTLTLNSDGSFSYSPDASFVGTDQFTYKASDGANTSDKAVVTLAVLNRPPTAALAGPASGVRGQPRTFTFAATDVPSDQAAGFTYTIDWADGSPLQTITRMAGNGAGVAVDHVFTATGTYRVQVTAADQYGLASQSASQVIAISRVAVETDPADPGKRVLAVGGSVGNDEIEVESECHGKIYEVELEEEGDCRDRREAEFTFHVPGPIDRIVVYGQAGNDDIDVEEVAVPAALFGGSGNDVLRGGQASNILVGGPGDDLLIGGSGRDLLIGGTGADRIIGKGGDDILIAGTTAYDDNLQALQAIMKEWNSSTSYASRISHLMGPTPGLNVLNSQGVFLVAGPTTGQATVFDDSSIDVLTGSAGQNWLWANLTGMGVKDKVTDLDAAEPEASVAGRFPPGRR
jgi:hypothetical protein